MTVFITGGHGHIGSWIAYLLAKEGQGVIIYDTEPRARNKALCRLVGKDSIEIILPGRSIDFLDVFSGYIPRVGSKEAGDLHRPFD